MQIAAFDKDVLSSDGVSTAKITWISRGASFTFPFSIISDGGVNKWEDCGCREFLRSPRTPFPGFPQRSAVCMNCP